nr:hypothetical protein TetV2_00426 [Oceanusvirus sp.]
MGLQTVLRDCDAVRSRSLDVDPASRRESDVINLAISDMLVNETQRNAIGIVCKRVPIIKPFVLMVLKSYIESHVADDDK